MVASGECSKADAGAATVFEKISNAIAGCNYRKADRRRF